MGCECTINGDSGNCNEFFRASRHVARKSYRCGECYKSIMPGDKYEYVVGKSEGEFWTFRTCAPCIEIRACFFCSWDFGCVYEYLDIEIDEDLPLDGLEGLSPAARDKFFSMIDI